ncbi:MAG TPA: acyl-CoA desaturase [Gaiellales bacterium]|nr:acyl-CoA desaturase [Gaiellales bacterium]
MTNVQMTEHPPVATAGWGQKTTMLVVTIIPFLGFIAAIMLLWNTFVGWTDLLLLAVLYVLCGFGITIGFHRMLTHQAFKAVKPLKAALLVFGSMAIQGPAITWAVDHRTHHAHSDKEGDPHSPHHGFGGGIGGQLRGLLHAHMGWMFTHRQALERARMGRDLVEDRLVRFVDRTFVVWAVMGFVLPFVLGYLLTGGTWRGAFTGLLWGGLVRLFLNHHVTWSVNSICHYFGRRPFTAYDLSTNNWVLALPSLGESWHHNHHVFPTSAFHGLGRTQIDVSGLVIRGWEKLGWVTDVRRPSSEQIVRKLNRSSVDPA